MTTVMELVAENYPVEPSGATLVRSFNNDVYRIDTDDDAYVLKVYGSGRLDADEVRWEQRLARELLNAGIPVAADVTTNTGDFVGIVEAPEGPRTFALTQWVPGSKPQPPWSDALYRSVGATLARLHAAADSFDSIYPRRTVRRGDEPERVIAVLDEGSSQRQLVQRTAATARAELGQLAKQGLRWGIRHGDASLDNIHVDEDGTVYFYDFDLAGPGWQIEDLAGAMSTEFAGPFLEGYVDERPLTEVDLTALPWLRILGHIDNLKFHLIDKPVAMGSSTLTEGWVDRGFEGLADAARDAGC
ncbi:phosphotransferase enzyme family protein [Auraticoccus monumenti]|uniref:Ser/Thr protein kinase RdoA involved in Cpx stress response, MazF antagonist n=1 Tax=Auraticoccus monumenti TaxID=675864 RepID=A0A1G6Z8H4_9ACTN|nr:phosphotransferase [Auraticoccus monumenti]SDD98890.1 Ser/Thr protein kinase RdoA involved in Cpx stress response, MazF antagonist [Auraticoccus monumenti]